MSNSRNHPLTNGGSPEISTWWRDRVSKLIVEDRKQDAASLYLEFCRPESRAIELSVHPHH